MDTIMTRMGLTRLAATTIDPVSGTNNTKGLAYYIRYPYTCLPNKLKGVPSVDLNNYGERDIFPDSSIASISSVGIIS